MSQTTFLVAISLPLAAVIAWPGPVPMVISLPVLFSALATLGVAAIMTIRECFSSLIGDGTERLLLRLRWAIWLRQPADCEALAKALVERSGLTFEPENPEERNALLHLMVAMRRMMARHAGAMGTPLSGIELARQLWAVAPASATDRSGWMALAISANRAAISVGAGDSMSQKFVAWRNKFVGEILFGGLRRKIAAIAFGPLGKPRVARLSEARATLHTTDAPRSLMMSGAVADALLENDAKHGRRGIESLPVVIQARLVALFLLLFPQRFGQMRAWLLASRHLNILQDLAEEAAQAETARNAPDHARSSAKSSIQTSLSHALDPNADASEDFRLDLPPMPGTRQARVTGAEGSGESACETVPALKASVAPVTEDDSAIPFSEVAASEMPNASQSPAVALPKAPMPQVKRAAQKREITLRPIAKRREITLRPMKHAAGTGGDSAPTAMPLPDVAYSANASSLAMATATQIVPTRGNGIDGCIILERPEELPKVIAASFDAFMETSKDKDKQTVSDCAAEAQATDAQSPTQEPEPTPEDLPPLTPELRPALYIQRAWQPGAPLPPSGTQLGGSPRLPEARSWPRHPSLGYPLHFLAAIDCAEASRVGALPSMPRDGRILVFADTGAAVEANRAKPAVSVMYLSAREMAGATETALPADLPPLDHDGGVPEPLSARPGQRLYPRFPALLKTIRAATLSRVPQAGEGECEAEEARRQTQADIARHLPAPQTVPKGDLFRRPRSEDMSEDGSSPAWIFEPAPLGADFPCSLPLTRAIFVSISAHAARARARLQASAELAKTAGLPREPEDAQRIAWLEALASSADILRARLPEMRDTQSLTPTERQCLRAWLAAIAARNPQAGPVMERAIRATMTKMAIEAISEPERAKLLGEAALDFTAPALIPTADNAEHVIGNVPQMRTPEPSPEGYAKLVQFDSDPALGLMFADHGLLEIWVPLSDLPAHRYDRAIGRIAGG